MGDYLDQYLSPRIFIKEADTSAGLEGTSLICLWLFE